MKTRNIIIILFIAIGFITLNSFGRISNTLNSDSEMTMSPQKTADQTDAKYAAGAKIYKEKCIICHMANGEGITGAFPPLKNSDYLFKDKVRAVAQALNGSQKAIVVNGVTYTAPMTPQVNTKEDAVAVINYVLNAWGNKGGTVTLDEVKNVVINPR